MSIGSSFPAENIAVNLLPFMREEFSNLLCLSPRGLIGKMNEYLCNWFKGSRFFFVVDFGKNKTYIIPKSFLGGKKLSESILRSKETNEIEQLVAKKASPFLVRACKLECQNKKLGVLIGLFDSEDALRAFDEINESYLLVKHISSLYWCVLKIFGLSRKNIALKKALLMFERRMQLETIGDIASSVAHEFNNILQAIESELDLLAREIFNISSERACSNYPVLIEKVNVLSGLLQDGKEILARLKGFGSKRETYRPVNIRQLILDTLECAHNIIKKREEKHGKKIDVELVSAGDVFVMGSPLELKEVLLNLILNGADAIEKEGTIRIGTMVKSRYVHIFVSDNGKGMTIAEKKKVFTPYYTTKPDGTGLGLALSLKFVRAHRGKIEFESVKGKGTVFKVSLPICSKPSENIPEYSTSINNAFINGACFSHIGNGLRILVVDDNDLLRESIVKLLRSDGFDVVGAKTKYDALLCIAACRFDLAIVDMRLGCDNGAELGRMLYESANGMPVVLSTGSTDEKLGNKFGFPIIKKPFSHKELIDIIVKLTKNKKAA